MDPASLTVQISLVFPTAPEQAGPSGKSHGPRVLCVTAIPDHQPVQGWVHTKRPLAQGCCLPQPVLDPRLGLPHSTAAVFRG